MLRRNVQSVFGAGLVFALALGGAACAKKSAPPPAGRPEFDQKWSEVAPPGLEVSYIEDYRGEGLMGNVRRASRVKDDPPAVAPAEANAAGGFPDQPPGE